MQQVWLERTLRTRKERVLSRMRGTGEIAEQIHSLFQVFTCKYSLDQRLPPVDVSQFKPPTTGKGQQWLF
ncbi:hypothetical protein [Gimesia fumaroli]|uniref:Uncharacterized protein n=1 Tax=Gimesia fumaroli TaxID=2527976 RepID=A0A518ILM3_9PLAN|nr:hypothetical protein [Gimesia fumaroli]QDV53973.1 hypothetical protein Enr17x_60560 [Gimesia fumaroli]